MFSKDTKIKEISHFKWLPALIKKHTGKKVSGFILKLGAKYSITEAANYLKWTDEQVNSFLEELNILAKEDNL